MREEGGVVREDRLSSTDLTDGCPFGQVFLYGCLLLGDTLQLHGHRLDGIILVTPAPPQSGGFAVQKPV